MQFAGQRTDLELNPVGEPYNILIRLTDEIVPDPDAILVTGITPQSTIAEGMSEAEFLHIFTHEIAAPDTIFMGYNTVRFDDEFMRFLHYRNFYDPYEWQWQDSRSRWDLLDVVRMTRALRPDGIEWPFAPDGKPTNRLEFLTKVNGLSHEAAHDALSDVNATIAMARLIYNKQTKLFEYLRDMRTKQKTAELVNSGEPFVYSSGRYPSEFEKTAVAVKLADQPKKGGVLVYDLRHDPKVYTSKTPAELAAMLRWTKDPKAERLPVKTMQFNRCPAIAPLGVLNDESQKRLQIDLQQIRKNLAALRAAKGFGAKVAEAMELIAKEQQTQWLSNEQHVDGQLYDGFFDPADKNTISAVRASYPAELHAFGDKLNDPRLKALLPLYKARNHSKHLTAEERAMWETFRAERLMGGGPKARMAKYFNRLQELAASPRLTDQQKFLLEELQLYGQSIVPAELD
jgi:exodeoxyribonuclease-1